jgi:hypothetical protein
MYESRCAAKFGWADVWEREASRHLVPELWNGALGKYGITEERRASPRAQESMRFAGLVRREIHS